jgi:uncharacterized protein YlxW (UPF0749 family)
MIEPTYGSGQTARAQVLVNAAPSADEQRADLLAQQRFLRERLKSIPPTAQLTRNSIVDRLEALDEELALLTEAAERPAGLPPLAAE